MARFVEFFEGENGRLSMTRLVMFLSFFPSSLVVILTAESETLGWYIGGYVLGYVGGKGADVFMKDKPVAEPSNVTINQPDKVNVS